MLLEIRLHTLSDLVDKFVLVESTHTFSGKPKKLHYNQVKDSSPFTEFKERIIHIIHDSRPGEDRWKNQADQRNAIALGLRKAQPDDIILVSDIDEIPNPEVFNIIKSSQEPTRLIQKLYYYFFNCQSETDWFKAFFCRYGDYRGADSMRSDPGITKGLLHGGWHFSYLMEPEK
jgi:beta-1,4-mannosyl-glycoprotein beta-1,4-N-acetylglucosaminyltransferase